MNLKKFSIIFVFFCFGLIGIFCVRYTCFSMHKESMQEIKHTLFIQGSLNTSALSSIKDTLAPIINRIIKEELGLSADYDFNFFLPKDWQRLTLYSVKDIVLSDIQKNSVFEAVEDVIQKNRKEFTLKQVNLAPRLNFFGEYKDELVIMVDDPDGELSLLNQEMTIAMHQANTDYKHQYSVDLYDIAKSEQFPYVPHIGLGRIRSTSIKQHIKDASQVDTIFDYITQRILEVSLPIVKQLLSASSAAISFQTLCIFDLPSRSLLKEYPLLKKNL